MAGFQDVMDRLQALEATFHPTLHVYRWWRADMALPFVTNWLTPSDVEAIGAPACRVDDVLRLTIILGVDPTAVAIGGDLLELEAYADLAIPLLNAELYGRDPLGVRQAKRTGLQTVAERLGEASILTLELPIEVKLPRPVHYAP